MNRKTIIKALFLMTLGTCMFIASVFFNPLYEMIMFGEPLQAFIGFVMLMAWWVLAVAAVWIGASGMHEVIEDLRKELKRLKAESQYYP